MQARNKSSKIIAKALESMVCAPFRRPFLLLAEIALKCDFLGLGTDLCVCINGVSDDAGSVPDIFIDALIVSEDHRNGVHLGVDPIAISRVIVFSWFGIKQGGSTIEQQFVRISIQKYEVTFRRKFREQLLATLLVKRVDRRAIAASYLLGAYFGTGRVGVRSFEQIYGKALRVMILSEVIEIVARLKYPQPRNPSAVWHSKLELRCRWIAARYELLGGWVGANHRHEQSRVVSAPLK